MHTLEKLRPGRFGPHNHTAVCLGGEALCCLCMTMTPHDDWNEMGAVTATALVCGACVVKFDKRYQESVQIAERRWAYSQAVLDEREQSEEVHALF